MISRCEISASGTDNSRVQLFESTSRLVYWEVTKPVILSPFLRCKTTFSARAQSKSAQTKSTATQIGGNRLRVRRRSNIIACGRLWGREIVTRDAAHAADYRDVPIGVGLHVWASRIIISLPGDDFAVRVDDGVTERARPVLIEHMQIAFF